MQDRDTVTTLG
jgi:hypothetical protein